jgi:hypothetical protein
MVVNHDDARCRLGDRGAEHLARMHQRTVEETSGNQDIAQHTALAVESQKMELFHRVSGNTARGTLGQIV